MIIMLVNDSYKIASRKIQVVTGSILYNDTSHPKKKIPKDAVVGIAKGKAPMLREVVMGREEPSFFGVGGNVGICLHEDVNIEPGDIITYPPLGT